MLGFGAKPPISQEACEWIERSMERFCRVFGKEALTTAAVVLPTAEFFPDEGNTPAERSQAFLERVCRIMGADPARIALQIFEDEGADLRDSLKRSLPHWEQSHSGAAGLYRGAFEEAKTEVSVRQDKVIDPVRLVATLAHEVGHEMLLGRGHVDREEPDMEPLTDLVTVFFGLGIFTANSAFQFRQYSDGQRAGWSVQRLGYLSEPMWGYALAYFAHLRGEQRPSWTKYLRVNVAHYYKQSARSLARRRRQLGP